MMSVMDEIKDIKKKSDLYDKRLVKDAEVQVLFEQMRELMQKINVVLGNPVYKKQHRDHWGKFKEHTEHLYGLMKKGELMTAARIREVYPELTKKNSTTLIKKLRIMKDVVQLESHGLGSPIRIVYKESGGEQSPQYTAQQK